MLPSSRRISPFLLALLSSLTAPLLHAEPPPPVRVAFQTEGRGTRFGSLILDLDHISILVDDSPNPLPISPDDLIKIDFNSPAGDPRNPSAPPAQDAPLAPPWKHATVGRLVAPASAHGDSHSLHLFTSAHHPDDPFRSFSIAYQNGPENGHITARVHNIGHRDHESRAGLIIRDRPGKDAANFALLLHPGQGSNFHAWRISNGYGAGEFAAHIRPPYWLRLIRDHGHITALISPDGRSWTKVHDIAESVILGRPRKAGDPPSHFGLIATSSKADSPWAASFDNIRIGSLEDAASSSATEPRILLTDGSLIRAPATSSPDGKLIQIGPPWDRTIPALYTSRIEFYNPIISKKSARLDSARPGVLLHSGDFFEASFSSLSADSLHVHSSLLGPRQFEPHSADAVVLNLPNPHPGRRAHFKIETADGQVFFAKNFHASAGNLVFLSPSLGEHAFPPHALRRISKSPSP